MYQATVRQSMAWDNATMRSDWNFDTIKSTTAMGTFRSMVKDLEIPPDMIEDDERSDDGDFHGSMSTGGATKGSDPLVSGGLGMNSQAAHSTVLIRTADCLDDDEEQAISDNSATPLDPLGAPPAYSGSVRTGRRASYQARTSPRGAGTVLNEADLGTGVDTIRPVKKVDPVGSLRLSSEYVGNIRREGSGSAPTSPVAAHNRFVSEPGRAGRAVIDEVVLPILQSVPAFLTSKTLANL